MNEIESQPPVAEPESPAKKKPNTKVILAVIVGVAVFFGGKNWLHGRNHQTTDDAQLASDIVVVSPLTQGTVVEVLAKDNQVVKKGDLLVRLDKSKLQADYDRAKANVAAAEADARSAGALVDYASANTAAGLATSNSVASEAKAELEAVKGTANASQAQVAGANASYRSTQGQVANARIDINIAKSNVDRATIAVAAAETDLKASNEMVREGEASLATAQGAYDLAKKNSARSQTLFSQGALSQSALDIAEEAETRASQGVKLAESALATLKLAVQQKKSSLDAAKIQLSQAKSAQTQAVSKLAIVQDGVAASKAALEAAKAQASVANSKISTAVAHQSTVQGQVQTSEAQQLNVSKLRSDQQTALARLEQAKAALRVAEIDLAHAEIVAPCDGRVSKRSVEQGSFVQTGTAMMFVVPESTMYVVANFKETQIHKMKIGDKVEIEVDGLPGKPLHGTLESLSAATGSTFALLPPDNSTGNFVKVVQRVPVKIKLDPADITSDLKVGYSVNVSVETR